MLPVKVQGGKPLTVSVGKLPIFEALPLIAPEMAHVIPVPARTPNGAAKPSGDGGGAPAATSTLAKPEIPPLVA